MQRNIQFIFNSFFLPYVQVTFDYLMENRNSFFPVAAAAYIYWISIINEEVLVALCFFAAVVYIYVATGESVTEALDEREEAIRKDLGTFLILIRENIQQVLKSEKCLLESAKQFNKARYMCKMFVCTAVHAAEDTYQEETDENLRLKLAALQLVHKASQPHIHAMIHDTIGSAVLENLTQNVDNELLEDFQINQLPDLIDPLITEGSLEAEV